MFLGVGIGTIVGTAASGFLIQGTKSWDSVFYFYGGIGIFWYLLWHLLCYSKPNEHPYISDEEKHYLKENIPQSQVNNQKIIFTFGFSILKTSKQHSTIFAIKYFNMKFNKLHKYVTRVLMLSRHQAQLAF